MSIVETYKKEFRIYGLDEDLNRGEKLQGLFGALGKGSRQGFNFQLFNSPLLFLEALKNAPPHVVLLHYQPLNLSFRENLRKIKEVSHEVEVVVLGGHEFWPGIHSLIQSGLVNDSWLWPMPGTEALGLRLERLIEKNIYKFIAEQRSPESQQIAEKLEALQTTLSEPKETLLSEGFFSPLLNQDHGHELGLIEEMISHLKASFPESEFIYFKNYQVKNQLLVTRTSFSSGNSFRGQWVPLNEGFMEENPEQELHQIRELIKEKFSCQDFLMEPVNWGGQFFGLIMAVHAEQTPFLSWTAKYLSLSLRNLALENLDQETGLETDLEMEVKKNQLALHLSTEMSRARHLKSPLCLLLAYMEFVEEEGSYLPQTLEFMKDHLRPYDSLCRLNPNQIALVLPHCSYENGAIKAEMIRRELLKTQMPPLRLCFGVNEFPSFCSDSDSLLEGAKQACQQVIVSGENKVCLYRPQTPLSHGNLPRV